VSLPLPAGGFAAALLEDLERRRSAIHRGEEGLKPGQLDAIIDALRMPALLQHQADVMATMDTHHPDGYPATRDGVFLGIRTSVRELWEAEQAWDAAKCKCATPRCDHADWTDVADEIEQAAAVAMRVVRSIRMEKHLRG